MSGGDGAAIMLLSYLVCPASFAIRAVAQCLISWTDDRARAPDGSDSSRSGTYEALDCYLASL